MAITIFTLKVLWIVCFGIWNFDSRIFIERMYDVALALTIITIVGSTFQPLVEIFFISGWYFF